MKTKIPKEALEQMQREGWASIQGQEDYWWALEQKEAVSNNATTETRQVDWQRLAIDLADSVRFALGDFAHTHNAGLLDKPKLSELYEEAGHVLAQTYACPQSQPPTTAETSTQKEEDLGGNEIEDRIKANQDIYDNERNDFDRGDLRDDGRNPDGTGLSYCERNT